MSNARGPAWLTQIIRLGVASGGLLATRLPCASGGRHISQQRHGHGQVSLHEYRYVSGVALSAHAAESAVAGNRGLSARWGQPGLGAPGRPGSCGYAQ
jgi:hypothetical protein